MLPDRTRRLEFGKALLDTAKYMWIAAVVGGFLSPSTRLDNSLVVVGMLLAVAFAIMGFITIPEEEQS